MRKITVVGAILLLSCMAIICSLASCNNPVDNLANKQSEQEQRYTVWNRYSTPDEFQKVFNTALNDGYFLTYEFDAAEWSKLSKTLTDNGKFMWTKAQITSWLLSQGLDQEQAAKALKVLTTIEHGCIASRHKDTVYYLLK